MRYDLDLERREADFEEAKQEEIEKIARERNKSIEDAAQIWEDESQED